ncbi:hypothetical protein [Spiroplasma endosymbiont of Aspidapion aeneum]|uniref:hypothetical protein n=1 Tax=Spiroplasma endosymbiont of Aspidapion aeneum TaxID=3066276 RepID=UPI00313E0C3C
MFDDISGKIAFIEVNGEYVIDYDFFHKEKSLDIKLIYFFANGGVVYRHNRVIKEFKKFFNMNVEDFLDSTDIDVLVDTKEELISKVDKFYTTYISFINNVLMKVYPKYLEFFEKSISIINSFRNSPEYLSCMNRFIKSLDDFVVIRKSMPWDSLNFYNYYRIVYKAKNDWYMLLMLTTIDIFKRNPDNGDPEKIIIKTTH